MKKVLAEVAKERERQDALWGEQNHPNGTGFPFDQSNAKWAKQMCEEAVKHGDLTYRDILNEEFHEALAESDPAKLRAELVQVAAVTVAWIEAIDRRRT